MVDPSFEPVRPTDWIAKKYQTDPKGLSIDDYVCFWNQEENCKVAAGTGQYRSDMIRCDPIISDHIRPRWDQISISKTSSTSHQKSSSMFLFIHVCSPAELLQDGRPMLALIQKEPPLVSAATCAPATEAPGAGRASSGSAPWSRAPKGQRTGIQEGNGWKSTTEIQRWEDGYSYHFDPFLSIF